MRRQTWEGGPSPPPSALSSIPWAWGHNAELLSPSQGWRCWQGSDSVAQVQRGLLLSVLARGQARVHRAPVPASLRHSHVTCCLLSRGHTRCSRLEVFLWLLESRCVALLQCVSRVVTPVDPTNVNWEHEFPLRDYSASLERGEQVRDLPLFLCCLLPRNLRAKGETHAEIPLSSLLFITNISSLILSMYFANGGSAIK